MIGKHLKLLVIVGALFFDAVSAPAANTPCSGSKGGVAGCRGETFICNDGSVSASKKSCSGFMGGAASLLGGGAGGAMTPVEGNECSCRSGSYCTGPKGGRYCTTDGGGRSYLRK